ncbi:hypothetical protein [Streptomyces cinereoruber]|uniref:hypothetical protein n=1 Tax=Streptomyces cinereoruber TaxID=67260 RepID=UPI0036406028
MASWSWVKPVHFLQDQPQGQPGVTLSWSSRSGPSGGWSYTVIGESGPESGRLPVPVLAAPSVIVEMMLHLWRGRPRLLRASEERWEWAEITESTAASAALLSEDKYDLDYQLDEEEAAGFERWQAELEGADALQGQHTAAEPDAVPAAQGEDERPLESTELTRYRIVAQRVHPEHPGASTVTNYVYGRSVEEAVAKAREELEKPGGLYGDEGLYRVVEVVEESPSSGQRQQEDARRRYLTTILEAARTSVQGREPENPDADLLELLDDFFTRAVVFPDPHNGRVRPRPHQATFGWSSQPPGITHASDPGQALALFLLAYLDHHGKAITRPGNER